MAVKTFLFCLLFLVFATAHAQEKKWKEWETEADTMINHADYQGAVKLYTRIVDGSKLKNKADFTILYKRAIGYYYLNEFTKALDDINRFIPEYPEMDRALLVRAYIYKGMDDNDHQLTDLNALLELAPGDRDLLGWRASVYLDKEDYVSAKKDFLAAKATQDDAKTEMLLGSAYYYLGQVDSAFISLNKAIELDATYLPSYLYAGYFCLQSDDYERAVKYLDVALHVDPTNNSAMFYKGIALVEQKKEKEGCRCLTKAFEAGEDDAGDYLKEYCYGIDD